MRRGGAGHVTIWEMRRGETTNLLESRVKKGGRTELHRLSSFSDVLVACHGREDKPTLVICLTASSTPTGVTGALMRSSEGLGLFVTATACTVRS